MKYWRGHEDSEGAAKTLPVSTNKGNHTKLVELWPNSDYLVEVRAFNSAGFGPPSERLLIRTKKPRELPF